jgi:hypothetical protein
MTYSHTNRSRFIVGVDLGQANDFTAVAILGIVRDITQDHWGGRSEERRYELLNLFRLSLGTPYPAVAEVIANTLKMVAPNGPEPALVVDATGVGRPVVDMLKAKGLRPIAVSITGGVSETSTTDFSRGVPKRNLVSTLLIAMQTGKLKFAADLETIEILRRELTNFKSKLTISGNETFEAWKESIHDDLVLALALAVWQAERTRFDARTHNLSMGR